jgi:hypothetical protein
MLPPPSCGAEIVETVSRFWSFLKSDECQVLFVVLATARALFFYLLRSPLREARELACTMAAAAIISGCIAISEIPRAHWFTKLAEHCEGQRGFASRDKTPSGTYEPRRQSADKDH